MSELRPPVVRSKLRPPVSLFELVERTRLLDRIADSPATITVVTAPPGYGKTTFVSRALDRLDRAAAWVSVDTADDTPVRFWGHVAAALAEVGVEVDAAMGSLVDGRLDLTVDQLLVAIDGFAEPLVLVLDDVHDVTSPVVGAGLERVLGQPPAGLRIVLTSRSDLDLGLARRRLAGDVLDMTAADLAFTIDEGRRAFAPEIDAGVLDSATAERLVGELEGWPAGIRLAQLALRNAGPTGADVLATVNGASPEVGDYLASEVLAGLEPDTAGFLLDTSILMDLTPGGCDAVTGRNDSLAVLRRLAADQVFTTLVDSTTSTFRTHRLFREFLLARLAERPDEYRSALHARAMRWAERSGDLDAVVWHGVAAGEHDAAMEVVADHLLAASNRGQIDDMWRWISWIGTERVLANPSLAALPAWVSLNQRRYDEIEPWLEAIVLVDDLGDEQRRDFAVHAESIRSGRARHLGDLAGAVRHAAEARTLVTSSDDDLVVSTTLATLAQAQALAGDPEAVPVAREAIDRAVALGQEPPLVMAYSALGMALFDDDPHGAEAAADSALSFVTTNDLERFHRPALAWLVRARTALDAGRVGDAEAAAGRTIEIARLGDEPLVETFALAVRARAHHLVGRDEEQRADLRAADALLDRLVGAERIEEEVRAAHAATRFAPGAEHDHLPPGARELSERELAVLRLLPFGLSRRELAAQLFVSENTVKTHLTSIRRKLGVHGRDDVVERAQDLGLLPDADG